MDQPIPTLEQALQAHIAATIKHCNGSIYEAARVLRVSRSTIYRMLHRGPHAHLALMNVRKPTTR